jgi:chromosome segregation ATPase
MRRLREQAEAYREQLTGAETERDAQQAKFTRAFQTTMIRSEAPPSDADLETAEARVRQLHRHVLAAEAAVEQFQHTVAAAGSRVRTAERGKARLKLAELERLYAEAQAAAQAADRDMRNLGPQISELRYEVNR